MAEKEKIMIKVSSLNGKQGRITRETTAPFIVADKAGQRTEEIRVVYYSLTIAESKKFRSALIEQERTGELYISDLLLPVLAGLPDLVDENEKPVKITSQLLESFSAVNLQAIRKAIEDDLAPKSRPVS